MTKQFTCNDDTYSARWWHIFHSMMTYSI